MTWGKFFMVVIIGYVLYYGIMILIDMTKGQSGPKLATDDGEAIDITGYDEDHVVNNLEEFTQAPVGSGINRSVEIEPAAAREVEISQPEVGNDALAGIMQPVVSKGFSLKELAEAAKAGSIEMTRSIAFA